MCRLCLLKTLMCKMYTNFLQGIYIYFAGDGRILKVVFATNGTQISPVFSEDIAVSCSTVYVYLQPLPL